MTAGAIVLAAGRSSRFGADKRLARLPSGEGILHTVLNNLAAVELPVLLCLKEADIGLPEGTQVSTLISAHAGGGMGATLAEAARHIDQWESTLVVLGDMPWVHPQTYRNVSMHCAAGAIAVPTYAGQRGNPVCFSRTFYPLMRRLGGDRGARSIVDAHPDARVDVDSDDPGVLLDIDTPEDMLQRPT